MHMDILNFLFFVYFLQGCTNKMISFVEDHVIYMIAVAGGVAVIQIIGMIFSMCLCCALKRIEDFKAWKHSGLQLENLCKNN